MLELVRQGPIVEIGAWFVVINVDVEHLLLVGEGLGLAREFIRGGVITGNAVAQVAGVQNVQMHVVVNAWRPFAAEKLPIGGIGLGLEQLGRTFQAVLIDTLVLFNPHEKVWRLIAQLGLDLEVAVVIHIAHREGGDIAHLEHGWR